MLCLFGVCVAVVAAAAVAVAAVTVAAVTVAESMSHRKSQSCNLISIFRGYEVISRLSSLSLPALLLQYTLSEYIGIALL